MSFSYDNAFGEFDLGVWFEVSRQGLVGADRLGPERQR